MISLSALNVKLLRDMWRRSGQVLAIGMVIAAAVATLIMALGALTSLSGARAAYYDQYRFADIFVSLKRAPDSVISRLKDIPGIARVQGRLSSYATLDVSGMREPVRGLGLSLPRDNGSALNALVLRQGRYPDPARSAEILVHEAFAEANKLSVGSALGANINGHRVQLRVVGIVLSPEFIYVIGPGEIVPDNLHFGVFWMSQAALAAVLDSQAAFNEAGFTLAPGAKPVDVIPRIDAVLGKYGSTGAYDRSEQVSHAFIESEFGQLSTMAGVIPPIFLVVASFLVYSVISRQIETQREEIGLLKAFGYADGAIIWHFVKFALVTSIIGLLIGWSGGYWLADLVTNLYRQYFRFPNLELTISPQMLAISAFFAMAAAAGGAVMATVQVMKLTPAVAMAPPAPASYSSGILERSGLLAGIGTIGFMVTRHITRFPARSAMTVTGIALSLGLLISTTQFFDSVEVMIDTFFFRAQRQDVSVTFTELRNDAVRADLLRLPGVIRVELRRGVTARLTNATRSERVRVQGMDAGAELAQQVDTDGHRIRLAAEGLTLSRRLAMKLGVKVGDAIQFSQLDGRRKVETVIVAAIIDEFVGLAAYMERQALNRLVGDTDVADSAALAIDPLQERHLYESVRDVPGIFTLTLQRRAYELFRALVDQNIMTMVWFYCAGAAIIAFGVAYNASRITLSERSHELATLRVLGFHQTEVARILVGELALLTLAALPLGIAIGYGLSLYMIDSFTTDLFQMPFGLSVQTIGLSSVIVAAASAVSAAIAARRVMDLDLVRVLKTRE